MKKFFDLKKKSLKGKLRVHKNKRTGQYTVMLPKRKMKEIPDFVKEIKW